MLAACKTNSLSLKVESYDWKEHKQDARKDGENIYSRPDGELGGISKRWRSGGNVVEHRQGASAARTGGDFDARRDFCHSHLWIFTSRWQHLVLC